MKYRVTFEWLKDKERDAFIVTGLKELKGNVDTINNDAAQKIVGVDKITSSGEYVSYINKDIHILNK